MTTLLSPLRGATIGYRWAGKRSGNRFYEC